MYLTKKGLEVRGQFLKIWVEEYGIEKVEEWMEDKEKRQLINALCDSIANH